MPRSWFPLQDVTQLHADIGWFIGALAVALVIGLRFTDASRCAARTGLIVLAGLGTPPLPLPPRPPGHVAFQQVIEDLLLQGGVPAGADRRDCVTGPGWFARMGTAKPAGAGIFSLSGHVTMPGQYEAPLGVTLRELLDLAAASRREARRVPVRPRAATLFADNVETPLTRPGTRFPPRRRNQCSALKTGVSLGSGVTEPTARQIRDNSRISRPAGGANASIYLVEL